MGRVTRRHTVLRLGPGQDQSIRRNDTLAVEEPLEIRLNGEAYLVTMRTPGNDIDLVRGLLYGERIITDRSDIVLARYCTSGSDALLEMGPVVVRQMAEIVRSAEATGTDAARVQAYHALSAIVSWLRVPLDDPNWRSGS